MTDRTPLDDVEFLARSSHRVHVLETLASGPRSRPTLHEETGISQPTLGRVLSSLEDRNWVERRGREYGLTTFGEYLAEEFAELLETVESLQAIGDVITLLPTDRFDFDVRLFRHATITTPKPTDVLAHVRRGQDILAGGDFVRMVTPSIFPAALEDLVGRLGDNPPRHHEAIITDDALDVVMADPALVEATRTLLETDGFEVLRYDGSVSHILAVVDDTAVIAPLDENDLPAGFIETDDETVRSWVEAELDELRAASSTVTVDDLPD